MKHLIISIFFISTICFADEVKKPEHVFIYGVPNKLAEVDPSSGKVTFEKDAKPEDAVRSILSQYSLLLKQVEELKKQCPQKK